MAFVDLNEGILELFGEAQGFGDRSIDFNRSKGFSRFLGSCAAEYAKNKADGICTACKKHPSRPGRVTCQSCKEYFRSWRRANPATDNVERLRALRARKKVEGVCLHCPAKAKPDATLCAACTEYQRNWRRGRGRESALRSQRASRAKNLAAGRCYCGRPRDREGRKCCGKCIATAIARRKERDALRSS